MPARSSHFPKLSPQCPVPTGISYRDWASVGRIGRAEGATISERTRFVALAGVILSVYSIIVILSMWLPLVIFDPCQR